MPEKDETHCFVGSAHDKCGRCSATTCKRAASGRSWMAERTQPRDCHVLVMETQLAKSHPPGLRALTQAAAANGLASLCLNPKQTRRRATWPDAICPVPCLLPAGGAVRLQFLHNGTKLRSRGTPETTFPPPGQRLLPQTCTQVIQSQSGLQLFICAPNLKCNACRCRILSSHR